MPRGSLSSCVSLIVSIPPHSAQILQTGLFSTAITSLIAVSLPDLKPNPQDISTFHLEKIHQLLANRYTPPASTLPTLARQSTFSPPKYAIWVNTLWCLSLVISLTCALLATLLQQWARRYIRITQPPRYSPHKRARIRAFFSDGVENLRLPTAVEALPTLLHLSLFLFFAGLLVYLFNINLTVFIVVACCVNLFATVYACITFMPIFRPDSPYYTPLSSSAWLLYGAISYAILQFLRVMPFVNATWKHFIDRKDRSYRWLSQGMEKMSEEIASNPSSEIDGRILKCTIDALDNDHELEQFFEGIPGFFSSKVVNNSEHILDGLQRWSFAATLSRFLDQTLASNLVTGSVKARRLITCLNAADATFSHLVRDNLRDILSERLHEVPQSIEMAHSLRIRGNNRDRETGLYAQSVVAVIVASVQERDDRWFALAMDQLGLSRSVLQDYVAHGDSVLLANLIHITRKILHTFEGDHYSAYISSRILPYVSKFVIQHTLPKLQRDFCALWNEVLQEASNSGSDSTPIYILRYIRHLYLALHQGTNAAPTVFSAMIADHDDILSHCSSYPECNIEGHRPTTSGEADQAPTATSLTFPHHLDPLTVITPTGPDLPSLPSPYRGRECHCHPTTLNITAATTTPVTTDTPTALSSANPSFTLAGPTCPPPPDFSPLLCRSSLQQAEVQPPPSIVIPPASSRSNPEPTLNSELTAGLHPSLYHSASRILSTSVHIPSTPMPALSPASPQRNSATSLSAAPSVALPDARVP